MKRILVLILACISLAMPATALAAYNPLDAACGANGASDSTACSNKKDPIVGPHGAIRKASIIVAGIAGIIAVIIIMIAGLQFIVSNGDAQKIANARNALLGAAIGLVIIVGSESILLFVVNRL